MYPLNYISVHLNPFLMEKNIATFDLNPKLLGTSHHISSHLISSHLITSHHISSHLIPFHFQKMEWAEM